MGGTDSSEENVEDDPFEQEMLSTPTVNVAATASATAEARVSPANEPTRQ